MTLTHILVFTALALIVRALAVLNLPRAAAVRRWALLVISVLAVFWMQPALPVRGLDFWLPFATLALAVLGWAATSPVVLPLFAKPNGEGLGGGASPSPERALLSGEGRGGGKEGDGRENRLTALVLGGIALLIALTRYLPFDPLLTATRPPQTGAVLIALVIAAGLALAARAIPRARTAAALALLLLALFAIIKTPALAELASAALRALAGQQTRLAAAADLRWLGFSYLAFRLIHTARGRQSGRLPDVNLREYITYAVFFPAFTAGPIDRIERFIKDLRAPAAASLGWDGLILAGQRLVTGLVKKFVLADALALIALNAQNAAQVQGAGWAWLLAVAYSLMIFFDFSGYTDIAIAIALLLGIKLPENFNAPYFKPNLTQFWNNWHITLTQWMRAYYFNPVTRWLRTRALPVTLILLITQITTMLLIGLWHGVTWNFAIWGLWHGLGLFIHNRWSEFARARFPQGGDAWARVQPALGAAATFVYVTLGWVWFALPSPALAARFLAVLFGG